MKNIPRKIKLPTLLKSEIEVLSELFFYSDKSSDVKKVDLLVIFGVSNQLADCVKYLKSLLKNDFRGTIIFSGGVVVKDENLVEAKLIYNSINNKLEKAKVILETESTNTYENVVFSLRKVRLDKVKSIGIVNSNLNSFRAYLTLKKYLGNKPIRIYRFSYPYVDHKKNSVKLTRTSWIKSNNFKKRIASELERIITYGKKGNLDYDYFKNVIPKSLISKFNTQSG